MTCGLCGAEPPPGAVFCHMCGQRLAAVAATVTITPAASADIDAAVTIATDAIANPWSGIPGAPTILPAPAAIPDDALTVIPAAQPAGSPSGVTSMRVA